LEQQRLDKHQLGGSSMPKKKKILVADDTECVRDLYLQVLRHAGYEVITAIDGNEGLIMLRDNPDVVLVITDEEMPEMTGDELLAAARLEGFKMPFILTGGRVTDDRIEKFIHPQEDGVPAFTAAACKPVLPNLLREMVANALA